MYAYSLNILYLINLQPVAFSLHLPASRALLRLCMLPCASSTSQPEGLQRPSRGPAEGLHRPCTTQTQCLRRACGGPAQALRRACRTAGPYMTR